MKGLTRDARLLLVSLVGVNALALAVRVLADNAGAYLKPYMETFHPSTVLALADAPWWSVLLPIKEFGGRWGATGFLLVHWLEAHLGEPTAFYLLTLVMVSTGFVLTYLTFRSVLMAVLVGVALSTSTFNYHVYSVPGGVIMLPLVTFLFLFSYAQFRFIETSQHARVWAAASALTCVAFALSYEGWLDFIPLAWIVFPALAWHFHSMRDSSRSLRCAGLLALSTGVAVVYITVKATAGLDGLHPKGGEADLLSTYGADHVILALEDIVSSYFTFFFTTITTYFPPELFSFSLSSWIYGPNKIVELQEGYHAVASHLVHYNHLFLWRYYAGFLFALFLMWYFHAVKNLFTRGDTHSMIIFVLLTCTLVGSPTHLVIKWRPMHAAPFLGYQCYMSIMGFTLLLCYIVNRQKEKWGGRGGSVLVAIFVLNLIYCAYARPSLLSHMSQESFLGTYPDPRTNVQRLWAR